MKKPYIKRYSQISNITVWIVDGNFIRCHIDEEFTNFGQHYRFKFIPESEFWIDQEHGKIEEERFYIDHMLVEYRLMKSGIVYEKAIEKADLIEKRERSKVRLIKNLNSKENKELVLKKIKKELLKKYSKDIKVWVIRGDLVRDLFFIDFTEGGHDKVYPFIPEKEIWIDDDINMRERKFILLHEAHERNLMSKGLTYDEAHKSSSTLEHHCRMHPEETKAKLEKELKITI